MKSLRHLVLVTALAALGLVGESQGGLMTDANYSNPVTYQQHLDLGRSYQGTVVKFWVGTTETGSGVLINNRRCVLVAAHQVEEPELLDPVLDQLHVTTGINFLTSPGLSIPVEAVIRHPTRTAAGVGTDLALVILKHDLPGGVPAELAASAPAVNAILDLIGYGKQATPNLGTFSPITGDLIGGHAPISNVDTRIRTVFSEYSAVPLIYNANSGDSGGGAFGSNRKLHGIMVTGSAPAGGGFTYSIRLSLAANYDWIQQTTAPYTPAPQLTIAAAPGQVVLTVDQPLVQYGGSWVLQSSPDLHTWTDSTATFNAGTCTLPASGPSQFYHLTWRATP